MPFYILFRFSLKIPFLSKGFVIYIIFLFKQHPVYCFRYSGIFFPSFHNLSLWIVYFINDVAITCLVVKFVPNFRIMLRNFFSKFTGFPNLSVSTPFAFIYNIIFSLRRIFDHSDDFIHCSCQFDRIYWWIYAFHTSVIYKFLISGITSWYWLQEPLCIGKY